MYLIGSTTSGWWHCLRMGGLHGGMISQRLKLQFTFSAYGSRCERSASVPVVMSAVCFQGKRLSIDVTFIHVGDCQLKGLLPWSANLSLVPEASSLCTM